MTSSRRGVPVAGSYFSLNRRPDWEKGRRKELSKGWDHLPLLGFGRTVDGTSAIVSIDGTLAVRALWPKHSAPAGEDARAKTLAMAAAATNEVKVCMGLVSQ